MQPDWLRGGGIEDDGDTWVVLKFGGSSVATAAGWNTIAESCARVAQEGRRSLVVCSALAGISDRLEELIEQARSGEEVDDGIDAVRQAHLELADRLGIELPGPVSAAVTELHQGLEGIRLLRDASPRVRARIMALGEVMSTRLGCAWLAESGIAAAWTDARQLLRASDRPHETAERRFLSAEVIARPNRQARALLPADPVVVTQGFIASDQAGETVLLGRGGSDTSAAYLAVLIDAERIEIWTDVPGLFTANPRRVADARHLGRLGYDEAAAMSSLGARVLHPRCIGPACRAGVPLHVRSTYLPSEEGTVVAAGSTDPGIKAVTHRNGLALLRMCRPSQWQPVGFVADVSACFKRHRLSIDLMSTSPSTLAVTVDPASAPRTSFDALLCDLESVCDVTLQRPVASVSVVGTGVRDAFHRVGGAMQRLGAVSIEMVAQGAADHHLTFVVDEESADQLVLTLHEALFRTPPALEVPTPTWRDLDRSNRTVREITA